MARLHLIRHGQAAAGWDADPDPGLDDVGRAQAAGVAATMAELRVDAVARTLTSCALAPSDRRRDQVSTRPSADPLIAVDRPCGSARYAVEPISMRREAVRLNSSAS